MTPKTYFLRNLKQTDKLDNAKIGTTPVLKKNGSADFYSNLTVLLHILGSLEVSFIDSNEIQILT